MFQICMSSLTPSPSPFGEGLGVRLLVRSEAVS